MVSLTPLCSNHQHKGDDNDDNNNKNNSNYLSKISGKHEIKELQTTDILCTARTFREVLM